MKAFYLLLLITALYAQTITYRGFKDFWPLRLDGDTTQGGAGEELESGPTVAARANTFFIDYPEVNVIDVDYVLYAQHALRNRDQTIENAPLAVNRLREDNDSEDQDTVTNLEVWRYTFTTTSEAALKAIMPDREERIESNGNSIMPVYLLVTSVIVMFV